jgi:hypothetical protein
MMARAFNSLSGKPPNEGESLKLFKFTSLSPVTYRDEDLFIPKDTEFTKKPFCV